MNDKEITPADAQNLLVIMMSAPITMHMSADAAVKLIIKLDRIANPGSYDR